MFDSESGDERDFGIIACYAKNAIEYLENKVEKLENVKRKKT